MKTIASLILAVLLVAWVGAAPGESAATPIRTIAEVAPNERQRLAPDQLATYLPERVGSFRPVPDSYQPNEFVDPDNPDLVASDVQIDYRSPLNRSRGSGAYDVRIRVSDWIDQSQLADRSTARLEREGEGTTELWDGRTETRTRMGTTWIVETVRDDDFAEVERRIFVDGRFNVTLTAKRNPNYDFNIEAMRALLKETYETSALSEFGDAPVYAEAASVSGPPAWISGGTEDPTLAIVSCAAALPVAEVEHICDVSGVRAVDTGMVSEGDCNRLYKRGDSSSGFIFLLSRFQQAAMARDALGVASDTDREDETRPLPDLADGGYSFVSATGEPRVAFVIHNALIELKASENAPDSENQLCRRRDQVEEIARGVAERLTH